MGKKRMVNKSNEQIQVDDSIFMKRTSTFFNRRQIRSRMQDYSEKRINEISERKKVKK